MFIITTECLINSTPDKVWRILTDFDSYKEWNPFITDASRNEENLEIIITDNKPKKFNPYITAFYPGKELRWVGKVGLQCLLKAEHYFLLQTLEHGQIRLTHGEIFSGLLAYTISNRQKQSIKNGFNAMNHALIDRIQEHRVKS